NRIGPVEGPGCRCGRNFSQPDNERAAPGVDSVLRRFQLAAAAAGPVCGHGATAGLSRTDGRGTLGVGQRLQIDFALELGSVNEQVSVSANATVLETASSEIGQVRPAREIMDLPLN